MNKTIKCSHCGNEITEHDEVVEIHGKAICSICADNETVTCERCGQIIWDSEDVGNEDVSICESCFDRYYKRCEVCDEIMLRDDAVSYKGTVYCNRCYTETLEDEEAKNIPFRVYPNRTKKSCRKASV